MKITKRANNPLESIINFKSLHKMVLDCLRSKYSKLELGDFKFSIWSIDQQIDIDSYEEFISNYEKVDLKKIEHFMANLSYKPNSNQDKLFIYLSIRSIDNDNLEISFDSKNLGLIEEIFKKIFVVLNKCKVYIYDAVTERSLAIRKKRQDEKNRLKLSISKAVSILENLNQLQLRLKKSLENEDDLQSFLYPILRSHFSDLEDEFHLPRFGDIEYKPDFGIPNLALLLETKYVRKTSDIKKIQKEIMDDSQGYLRAARLYKELIVFIYNSKNIGITSKFTADLEKISGIRKVIVVAGVNPE